MKGNNEDNFDASEWSNQDEYVGEYRKISRMCREAEIAENYEFWGKAILSKINHAAPILSNHEEEVKTIRKKTNETLTFIYNTIVFMPKIQNLDDSIELIRTKLSEIEGEIDVLFNSKSPFLKIKTQKKEW